MLVVIGTGGHAKVVLDALISAGAELHEIVLRDDDSTRLGGVLFGVPIVGPSVDPSLSGLPTHVAIGSIAARQRLYGRLAEVGAIAANVIHPAARISARAAFAGGLFAAAGAVIGPDVRIGTGVIVNHNAVVDHDCTIGDFCHIAPGAVLGGGTVVGAGALVGAGAVVLPGRRIGAGAAIGGGAVVIRDVSAGETHVGVPAAKI